MYWIYIGNPNKLPARLRDAATVEDLWEKLYPRQVGTFEQFKERIEAGEMFYCFDAMVWKGELNPVSGTDEFKAKAQGAWNNRFKSE